MEHLPISVTLLFILTVFLSIWLFYRATQKSFAFLIVIGIWIVIQTLISLTGFYTVTDTVPPRLALAGAPALMTILILFITTKGIAWVDKLDIKALTILHVVRIPVEIVLLYLFIYKLIPGLMTFEGKNFDILSGISAPCIYYLAFRNNTTNKKLLLVWNFICLALLINIVARAILSAPFIFQKMGFDQPNIAILHFPFVLLPACIVPLVLLSHFAAIRKLTK